MIREFLEPDESCPRDGMIELLSRLQISRAPRPTASFYLSKRIHSTHSIQTAHAWSYIFGMLLIVDVFKPYRFIFYQRLHFPRSARTYALLFASRCHLQTPKYWSSRLYRFALIRNSLKLWIAKAWAILILRRARELVYVSDCTHFGRT